MSKDKSGWDNDTALKIVQEKTDLPGALLPILNDLQDNFGYINPDFVPQIAKSLNLSRADVHGVISFYHDFRDKPPAKHIVKICRAEACQSMGVNKLVEHAESSNRSDVTLESVYCLGNCACAPAVMVNDKTYGRVSPEKLEELLS